METLAIKQETFQTVLGASAKVIEDAILDKKTAGESSLNEVINRLAKLLDISKQSALNIIGVSRSRKSKNPNMNVELLDRTYSALNLYSRVTKILGNNTQIWFKTPKVALGGKTPLILLETRVGLYKLSNMITALEDGAYL